MMISARKNEAEDIFREQSDIDEPTRAMPCHGLESATEAQTSATKAGGALRRPSRRHRAAALFS